MEPIAHDIQDVKKRLRIKSTQTVYNEINSGRLRSYKIGRRRFVSEEACVDYVHAREAEMLEATQA